MIRYAVLLITIFITASALADTGGYLDMSLEELLDIPITVASKSEEKLSDASSSVTVFTRAQIEDMGFSTLEELLNFVPGFQTVRDVEQGMNNRISARGRSTGLSESVLLLVNGQRLNDLYTGGVSVMNRFIPVEMIRQVEIIRGPGSALYGSNAFLGVINVITEDEANVISAQAGNLNHQSAFVQTSAQKDELHVAAFAKVFRDEGDTYKNVTDFNGQTGDVTDPRRGVDFYGSVRRLGFSAHARYTERDLRGFLLFGGMSEWTNRDNVRQSGVTLRQHLTLKPRLELKLTAGYAQDKWQAVWIPIPAGTELAPDFVLAEAFQSGPWLESYQAQGAADFSFNLSPTHQLQAGLAYEQGP